MKTHNSSEYRHTQNVQPTTSSCVVGVGVGASLLLCDISLRFGVVWTDMAHTKIELIYTGLKVQDHNGWPLSLSLSLSDTNCH